MTVIKRVILWRAPKWKTLLAHFLPLSLWGEIWLIQNRISKMVGGREGRGEISAGRFVLRRHGLLPPPNSNTVPFAKSVSLKNPWFIQVCKASITLCYQKRIYALEHVYITPPFQITSQLNPSLRFLNTYIQNTFCAYRHQLVIKNYPQTLCFMA